MITIDKVINRAKGHIPSLDTKRVKEAYLVAKDAHQDQVRKSGEPFIIHPLEVADSLLKYNVDEDTFIAALLHDVIEDSHYEYSYIKKKFGQNVAFLVDGVTKLDQKLSKKLPMELKVETLRKIFSSIAKDQRVLLIKLLDRLHNLQTIGHLSVEKQSRIAEETMDFYVPLAKIISFWDIKTELENLCFQVLHPRLYKRFTALTEELLEVHGDFLNEAKEEVLSILNYENISAEVNIDIFPPYTLYQLRTKGHELENKFFHLNICTKNEDDCYLALRAIHKRWKPISNSFKDYIAIPKEKLYQALHTSVIDKQGKILKIVIQTREMRQFARIGAQQFESETKVLEHEEVDNLKTSINELNEICQTTDHFIDSLKNEVFCDYINFFDDKGDAHKLPKGSSILDFFFYTLSQQTGKKKTMKLPSRAIVNGKKVSLKSLIEKDNVIKLVYNGKKTAFSPLMLRYVKTNFAKHVIKKELHKLSKEQAIKEGEKLLQDDLTRMNLGFLEHYESARLKDIIKDLKIRSYKSLMEKMGRGEINNAEVLFYFYKHFVLSRFNTELDLKMEHDILIRVYSDEARIGFVNDILQKFRSLQIGIMEIKGYSPKSSQQGVVDILIQSSISKEGFSKLIVPLGNTLEQILGVSNVKFDLFRSLRDSSLF